MRIIKWIFIIAFWAVVIAFLHYTLPQRDIVRVTDTYTQRIDFGENSIFWANADTGNATTPVNRDVFFIQTRKKNGSVLVYRNEDTGWGWPPYFKFDTANLQAEAADLRSTSENPRWALLKHYGWRNELFSIYPNALDIRPVSGPDASKGIPWETIIVLVVLAAIFWAIWVRWRRFRRSRIDPTLEEWEDSLTERGGRMRRWWGGGAG
jgi:hypothetical protein